MSLARWTVLLACLALPAAAAAADAPVFALKPVGHQDRGWFRFDGEPGGTITGRVRVVNAGSATGTAELAAVDAATGATTGAVYETVGSPSEDVGAWLALDTDRVTLAPGESAVVGYELRVPADARRGEHLGGIVARPAAPAQEGEADGDFRVTVVDQAILGVEVDLPGAARRLLAVRGVKASGNPGYQTLLIALSNPGERMVKGRGTAIVTGADGGERQRLDFPIDTFLPRTRIDFPLVLRGDALVPGDYRVEVLLSWDGGQHSRTVLPFSVSRKNIEQAYGSEGVASLRGTGGGDDEGVPVVLLGGGLLLVLLLVGGLGWMFRRRTRELERRLAAAIAPPEAGGEIRVSDERQESLTRR